MKKALAILMTLALVASAATAEVTWGIWGRGVFVPVQSTNVGTSATDATAKSVLTTENVASWGGNQRLGFSINAASDNVGFHVDLTGDIASVGIGDQAKAWFKFNDMFKVEFGKVQFDALRGKIGDVGGFQRYVGTNSDEDAIFTRFYPGNGAVVEITPVEGAVIAASVNPGSDAYSAIAENVYKNIQVGAGYTIAGIGQIRAQYIGNTGKITIGEKKSKTYYWNDTTKAIASTETTDPTGDVKFNNAKIQAAFNLTAVQNLNLDIGATIPLDSTMDNVDVKANDGISVNLGAKFTADKLGIYLKGDVNLGKNSTSAGVKSSEGLGVNVFVEPSYALDAFTVGLDGAYGMVGKTTSDGTTVDKTDSSSWGVAPFIQKNFSNGLVKVGFAFSGKNSYDAAGKAVSTDRKSVV